MKQHILITLIIFALFVQGFKLQNNSPTIQKTICLPQALSHRTSVCLTNRQDAQRLLRMRDEFIIRCSDFDRKSRVGTTLPVSEELYIDYHAMAGTSFTLQNLEYINKTLISVKQKFSRFPMIVEQLPSTIYFVKTSGKEEADTSYMRGNSTVRFIVFADSYLRRDDLEQVILGKVFHIFTFNNEQMRSKLYSLIHFKPCGHDVEIIPSLKKMLITNPDAYQLDHYIELPYQGVWRPMVPILYSDREYNGGDLFEYLKFRMLVIENVGGRWKNLLVDGKPVLVDVSNMPEYYQKIGKNARSVAHPEEKITLNFRVLANYPSQGLLRNVENVLIPNK